jgi:hypothetical protein
LARFDLAQKNLPQKNLPQKNLPQKDVPQAGRRNEAPGMPLRYEPRKCRHATHQTSAHPQQDQHG